jgi:translocator protein
MKNGAKSIGALALLASAPAAAAGLGAWVSRRGGLGWYHTLKKPRFNPPDRLFGPVWTALYGLMTLSAFRVWRRPPSQDRTRALSWWVAQLAFNALWSPIFFGLRRPRAALVDIAALLPAIGAYIVAARRVDRAAAWLVAPYAAWVAFATVINEEIVRRNPRA